MTRFVPPPRRGEGACARGARLRPARSLRSISVRSVAFRRRSLEFGPSRGNDNYRGGRSSTASKCRCRVACCPGPSPSRCWRRTTGPRSHRCPAQRVGRGRPADAEGGARGPGDGGPPVRRLRRSSSSAQHERARAGAGVRAGIATAARAVSAPRPPSRAAFL
ncbi:hypothetical protein EVAR_92720_1 [Eumeta japonica]|uniref:Uncharacterized protein n=1 Tax=Eumeta variegata TaxID=151549 RepID=A0A4C1T038_EUMVA|nr:hypothetical protein EVAR_92720_1 [Eumeta japonica]